MRPSRLAWAARLVNHTQGIQYLLKSEWRLSKFLRSSCVMKPEVGQRLSTMAPTSVLESSFGDTQGFLGDTTAPGGVLWAEGTWGSLGVNIHARRLPCVQGNLGQGCLEGSQPPAHPPSDRDTSMAPSSHPTLQAIAPRV